MDRRERLQDVIESNRMAHDGRLSEMWTALPGIIQSYDPEAITVTVQPALRGILTDERGKATEVTLPLLVDVPVCFPCGGGFTLTFPIKSGDEALVVFSSRCIDSWWQSGGIQGQAEQRMHDLSDGMAIVGLRSQPRVLNPVADPENIQLRSDDGEQHITITPDGAMTARATTSLTLEAPQITIQGLGGGRTKVSLKGKLTASDDVAAQTVSLYDHVHTDVQSGPSLTGEPQK